MTTIALDNSGPARLDRVTADDADPRFVERVPISYARRHRLLGLCAENERMTLAAADPRACFEAADVLRRYLAAPIRVRAADEMQLMAAINGAYEQREGQAEQFLEELDGASVHEILDQVDARDDLLESDHRAPVVKLVNLLIFEAVKASASDLHAQPYEQEVVVRLRIDGVLFDFHRVPKHLQDEMASRFKIIGGMNIAERRLPQDGRATVRLGERVIDLRISSVPTSCGERIVIRLLDKGEQLYSLEELGMAESIFEGYRQLIHLEHGLALITGPTGSGKTTSLYAALQQIDATQRNVMTLEDPIEYQLPGVSQMQVNVKKGMTFASGLRSVLRQDPDIIMVGEVRDQETAIMAIQSALTGHLVFSTLHTNDAASAVARLLDLGIEPYLVASSVVGVMAQRLVRRVCPECATLHDPPESQWRPLGFDVIGLDRTGMRMGAGCDRCRHTGYRGRLGLFELLTVGPPIRELIQQRAPAGRIKDAAVEHGMTTLRVDGLAKVLRGDTTLEEVIRVTND